MRVSQFFPVFVCLEILAYAFFASAQLVETPPIDGTVDLEAPNQIVMRPSTFAEDLLDQWWEKAAQLGSSIAGFKESILDEVATEFSIPLERLADFKSHLEDVVASCNEIKDHVVSQGLDLHVVGESLGETANQVVAYLQEKFPDPDTAPGHEARERMIEETLTAFGVSFISKCVDFGMDEDRTKAEWEKVHSAFKRFLLFIAYLFEQYPLIFEILIFFITLVVIPEGWIIRQILGLFGFTPLGPSKGSIAAWLQRLFWGKAVARGSWFALLQSAAMKGAGWGGRIVGAAFAGLVALFAATNTSKPLV